MELTYTFFGDTSSTFSAASSGNTVLALPFMDTSGGTSSGPNAYILAYPGRHGDVTITDTQSLNFVEALMRWSICQQPNRHLDFLAGYRFGRFSENLSIVDSTTFIPPTINKTDLFDATNEFNGLEFGLNAGTRCSRWSLDVLAKLALGDTHSRTDVQGFTNVVGLPGPLAGGLFAQATNSGLFDENHFAVIPELGFTLGYDLTARLKASVGYTFVYWSSVMRPGDQIDTNVNSTQVPPPIKAVVGVPSPEQKSVMTDFWAQGVSAGLEYRY
jgi:hypothetical protein